MDRFLCDVNPVADTDTQKTVNGYIWIQHDEGWSAKHSEDKSQKFLQKVDDSVISEDSDTPLETLTLRTTQQVRVRKAPTLSAQDIRFLQEGEIIETQSDSRTERDGYVWWQHKEGWSASQSLDGRWVFMETVSVAEESTPEDPEITDTTLAPATPVPTPAPAVPIATPEVIELQASTDVRIRSES